MTVQIVRAGVEQLDVLVELFDAYRVFYGRASDAAGARAFLGDRLRAGESVAFLAVRGDVAVGFVQLFPTFSSVSMRPIWTLNDLFVVEAARRVGVARSLLDAAAALARTTGAACVRLSTGKANEAAKAMYSSSGWHLKDFDQYELLL